MIKSLMDLISGAVCAVVWEYGLLDLMIQFILVSPVQPQTELGPLARNKSDLLWVTVPVIVPALLFLSHGIELPLKAKIRSPALPHWGGKCYLRWLMDALMKVL